MPPTRDSSSAHRFETVRKVRRYEQVADQIRRLISEGTLQTGDLLPPERELAVRLGVGRSSVRDAVRTLEVMGILEPRQGHGTVVRDPSADSLVVPLASVLTRKREMVVELLDVRRIIEPALGARAARNATDDEIAELTEVEMGRLFAVEIVYRGIFQKKLAANISRAIVLAAHKEGKPGISFGRYGDSPERNGIPAKYFAIVATDELTLEEGKAKYEPKEVDISICVDDTLFKGVESWAWYGLQPINKLLKPGGTLIVTSLKEAEQLIPLAHRKETPYKLAVLKGTPSFSGLWVYKDDHTDVRILGAMARVLPELFGLGSVQETIRDEWKNELKATSALRAFERVTTVNETQFTDNASQWEAWRTDKPAYEAHLAEWIKDRPERSHGFRFRGQYQQELPNEFARQG